MKQSPHLSVIIPAYFSASTVAECLGALVRQTYSDFEVILVNSSPEQETERAARRAFPEVVFKQSRERLYPHAARSRGVRLARGEIFVFTDPDCRAREDWLEQIVAAHGRGHQVVGGAMGLLDRTPLGRAVHLCKFSWLLPGAPGGVVSTVCTANASYTRRVFDQVGPFDEDLFIGDALLSWRAHAAGFPPWFQPGAVVDHHHEGSLAHYWREFETRGRECGLALPAPPALARPRALARALLLPALVALALLRVGRHAGRAGWMLSFFLTLPLQGILQSAWAIGEARSQLDIFRRGRPRHRPRTEDEPQDA